MHTPDRRNHEVKEDEHPSKPVIHSLGCSPEPKPKSMKLYEELPNRQPMSQCCFLIKESETGTWKSSCQWSHIPEGFYENTKYF